MLVVLIAERLQLVSGYSHSYFVTSLQSRSFKYFFFDWLPALEWMTDRKSINRSNSVCFTVRLKLFITLNQEPISNRLLTQPTISTRHYGTITYFRFNFKHEH